MKPPRIDWARPWLAPYRARGEPVEQAACERPTAQALQAGVDTGIGDGDGDGAAASSVRFVAPESRPPDEAYETHILRTGNVPTRDNLHDFFNGLVWLHFPQAKRRLNALQAGEIARAGVGATRGALRDALTLFDENGAVFDAPKPLWDALVARDWQRLFVTERARWQEARLLLFGHALLEKLVVPRKAATAHVLWAPGASRRIAPQDGAICAALDRAHLAAKAFAPLPVLGVPGWWAGNANFCFYDDPDVFRPRRPPEQTTTSPGPRRRAA